MRDDLQRAALGFWREYGLDELHEVLQPYVRPGSKLDLRLIVDRRAALVALAMAQAEPEQRQGV